MEFEDLLDLLNRYYDLYKNETFLPVKYKLGELINIILSELNVLYENHEVLH